MNPHLKRHLLATLLCIVFTAEVRAQGTAFTYQGQLTENSVPATGLYDFRFTLHDSTGGAEVLAGPLTQESIEVINGLFTTTLDFGAAVFTGSDRWLEIGLRTNGGSAFTALAPRQSFTSTPYAIRAAQFSGQIGGGQLAGTYDNAITFSNPANSFNGSGAGLAELNASALASGTVPAAALGNAWRIGGNAGTTAGANFVGTTDNQPLELVVNGRRGLRIEPTINDAPNVIGGASVNRVRSGVVGATVGGGGAANYFGSSFTNAIESDFGVVSGGGMNLIGTNSPFATIGGGGGNVVLPGGVYSTVSGGTLNRIEFSSERATIAGGWANVIHSNANNATISGGQLHTIHSSAAAAHIAGGSQNTIHGGAQTATIGGGGSNEIFANASRGTISGGANNSIQNDAREATIGGGGLNIIAANAQNATIGGGAANRIDTNAFSASIAGGFGNLVASDGNNSSIGGGQSNTIHAAALSSTIGGGLGNGVLDDFGTIPGGYDNRAGFSSFAAGYRAKADHAGSFVWADFTGADFPTTGAGQFLIRASGGVGINKTNPTTALDVNGTVTATAFNGPGSGLTALNAGNLSSGTLADARLSGNVALRNQNNTFSANQSVPLGSAAAPGLSFTGDTDTGLFSPAANTVALATGGAERLRVTSGGNVGMGIASPADPLHINTASGGTSLRLTSGGSWPLVLNQSASSVFTITNGGQGQFFLIAGGNVGIGTNNPAQRLHVVGNILATGTVTGSSDRNVKENFAPVDPAAVLEKVVGLPIQSWSYVGEPTPHIGPVAQDFYEAFRVGQDDRHISMVDADGVALAAIQGLNQKVESGKQKAEMRLASLEAENTELKQRLAALERIVTTLNPKDE